jgi:hypothetical protein
MIVNSDGRIQSCFDQTENLGGPYKTKEEAKRRLRQVEFFKHRKG